MTTTIETKNTTIETAIVWSCNNLAREYFRATKTADIPEDVDGLILELVHKAIKRIDPATENFRPTKYKSVPSKMFPGLTELVPVEDDE